MGKRILLIEPSRIPRKLYRLHLAQAGHQVITVPSPTEGLHILNRLQQEGPDLILLAVHNPGTEDYAVIEYVSLRPQYKQTNLVALIEQDNKAAVRLLERHSIQFLLKPVYVEQVLRVAGAAQ